MKKVYVIVRKTMVDGKLEDVMIISDAYTSEKDAKKKLNTEREILDSEWNLLCSREDGFAACRTTKYGTTYIEEKMQRVSIKV